MISHAAPGPDRPFATLCSDDSDRLRAIDGDEVLALFRRHGAVLMRGFDGDLADFRALTEKFCATSVFNESPDRRLLDQDHNIQTVNGGSDAFPLHPEISREPWKPDVAFFFCIEPPDAQGRTTICDGIALADALPDDVRAHFARHRLVYEQPASLDQLEYWLGTAMPSDAQLASPPPTCPYEFRRAHGGIMRRFSRPALHHPMFDDRAAFGNFLLFARDYLGRPDFPLLDDGRAVPEDWLAAVRSAAATLTVAIEWQAGDLLMLDNSRFMHGRTAIVDADRRVIATHFGYLRGVRRDPEEPDHPVWREVNFQPPVQGRLAA